MYYVSWLSLSLDFILNCKRRLSFYLLRYYATHRMERVINSVGNICTVFSFKESTKHFVDINTNIEACCH